MITNNSKADIYTFLARMLRMRNLRINEFYAKCNVSRTTFWRLMHGHQIPTEVQQERIIRLLELDTLEKSEFLECVSRLEFNENEIKSFNVIDNAFLSKKVNSTIEASEFIVHEDRKNVLTYGEILDFISEKAKKEDFNCAVTVFSCIGGDWLTPVERLISEVKGLTIDHYVRFFEDDELENTIVFKTIVPLLRHSAYNVYSRNMQGKREKEWMDDCILVRLPEKFMVLTLGDGSYQNCYISDSKAMYQLFLDRLSILKPFYEPLVKEKNINLIAELYHDFEDGNEFTIYKANPCYNLIQRHIWESVKSRSREEHRRGLFENAGEEYDPDKAEALISSFIDILDKRYKYTQRNISVHLLTKIGLRELMETGKLTDHTSWLPAFTKDEVRDILTNLLKRHLDPEDNLRIAIIDRDMDLDLCIMANSAGDLAIEYANRKKGDLSNCVLKQEALARTFMGFGERYAPKNISLDDKEIEKFILELVKK